MADALCGPANPLQQFKQVSQVDRTLQQDRLSSRHSPAQGFRSHNPNAGLLDPEFEAFQAGAPISELPQFHQQPTRFGQTSQAPSWATDFSRMNISSPPPFQQQYFPQAGPSTANWAQNFQQHVAQTSPRAQTSAQSPQHFQHMTRYGGLNGFQSNFAQPAFASNVQSKGKEVVTEPFDEAAFARAFDQAQEDMLVDDSEMQTDMVSDVQADLTDMEVQDNIAAYEAAAAREQDRLSQEAEYIHMENMSRVDELDRLAAIPSKTAVSREPEQQSEQPQQDDDALAATAKELLEKVEHNQTDKFRNSQFLSLMRKLRDREMKVEGDQMVETAAASSATTSAYPADSTAAPLFDNSEQIPHPLADVQPVDTRPLDYDSIPHMEQDHDAGRIDPRDGQDVVDHLNNPLFNASSDDIGTSNHEVLSEVSFYGETSPQQSMPKPLRQERGSRRRDGVMRSMDWTPWHAHSLLSEPEHAPFVQDLNDEYELLRRAVIPGSASTSTSRRSSGANSPSLYH